MITLYFIIAGAIGLYSMRRGLMDVYTHFIFPFNLLILTVVALFVFVCMPWCLPIAICWWCFDVLRGKKPQSIV